MNELMIRNREFADDMTIQGIDLTEVALLDPLSGAYNRGFLEHFWQKAVRDAQRREVGITAALLDLDDLKKINDTQGHDAGDQTLTRLGAVVKTALRPEDYFFRIGGDEFFLVLVGASEAQARTIIERIRILCLRADPEQPIRFSVGVHTIKSYQESWETAKGVADERMYENKRARKALPILV